MKDSNLSSASIIPQQLGKSVCTRLRSVKAARRALSSEAWGPNLGPEVCVMHKAPGTRLCLASLGGRFPLGNSDRAMLGSERR